MRFARSLLAAALVPFLAAASTNDITYLAAVQLSDIQLATENITAQIEAFNDIHGLLPIVQANTKLIAILANATALVAANPATLDVQDAFNIGGYTQQLAYAANASVANLIRKRPIFANLSITSTVVMNIQEQISASKNFSDVLIPKIPQEIQPVANVLNGQITQSLLMGQACFAGNDTSDTGVCNPTIVNSTRTLDAAKRTGVILPQNITGAAPGAVAGSPGMMLVTAGAIGLAALAWL